MRILHSDTKHECWKRKVITNTASILKNLWFNVSAVTGPVNTAGHSAQVNEGNYLIAQVWEMVWLSLTPALHIQQATPRHAQKLNIDQYNTHFLYKGP